MLANIRKSQEDGFFYGVTYKLEAELELTPEEQYIIDRHSLADQVIFDSENAAYYREQLATSFDRPEDKGKPIHQQSTEEQFLGIVSSFGSLIYSIGSATYNAVRWSFTLTLTVQNLMDGTTIESENHDEILQVETLIRSAIDALQSHVIALQNFEGQDTLIEPSDG